MVAQDEPARLEVARVVATIAQKARLGAHALTLRLRLASMLQRMSLPDLLAALTPSAPLTTVPMDRVEQTISHTERVIACLRVVPDTCLYRSLARYAVLREAGYEAHFVMGLLPQKERIEGHAWVELDREVLFETKDPDLVVTFTYPPNRPMQ